MELTREKFETTVAMAAIGYRYDLDELGKAQLLGMNLSADKANLARRVAEEKIEQVAFAGDTAKGFTRPRQCYDADGNHPAGRWYGVGDDIRVQGS